MGPWLMAVTAIAGTAALLAAGASAWAFIAGVAFGTFAIGGADSYGYMGQARLLAQWRVTVDGGEYEEFKKRFDATGQRASQHPALLATLGDARVYALP